MHLAAACECPTVAISDLPWWTNGGHGRFQSSGHSAQSARQSVPEERLTEAVEVHDVQQACKAMLLAASQDHS